jgi:hypothetical protein
MCCSDAVTWFGKLLTRSMEVSILNNIIDIDIDIDIDIIRKIK